MRLASASRARAPAEQREREKKKTHVHLPPLAQRKQPVVLAWLVRKPSLETGVRGQPVALYHPCVQMGMLQSALARCRPGRVRVWAAKGAWLERGVFGGVGPGRLRPAHCHPPTTVTLAQPVLCPGARSMG